MSVLDAVQSGTKRDTLVALRDNIAHRLDVTESGRDSAALSKRLLEIMDELERVEDEYSDTDGWGDVLSGVASEG